jgi:hypothetical protein
MIALIDCLALDTKVCLIKQNKDFFFVEMENAKHIQAIHLHQL